MKSKNNFIMLTLSKWERDLNKTLTAFQHQNITHLSLKSSNCTHTQESNYKLLTCWYPTPLALCKYFPDVSDQFWRCGEEKGTFLYIFWSCLKLQQYWSEEQWISQQFTDFPIPRDPAFYLLHCSQIPTYKKSVFHHLMQPKTPILLSLLCGLIRSGVSKPWKIWYLPSKMEENNMQKHGHTGKCLYIQTKGSPSWRAALRSEVPLSFVLLQPGTSSP